jgi:hypothetical protein
MLANPKLAPLFHYPATRTPKDGDIWDHALMKKREEEIGDKYVLELGYSSDGCVFQMWKKRAFTPNVCQMLNWPPGLRTCFGGMLLFAVFPPKVLSLSSLTFESLYINAFAHIIISTYIQQHYIYNDNIISTYINAFADNQVKNYHLFYTCVLEHNKDLWLKTAQGGEGKGLRCYDAHLNKEVTWYMRVAWLLEDVRGLPNPTGSKQAPAIVGACPFCKIRGSKLPTTKKKKGEKVEKGTTYYPGAICHCDDDELKVIFYMNNIIST